MSKLLWTHVLRHLYWCLALEALLLVVILPPIQSLRFHLQPNTKRCLKEEMRKDVLVTGEYELSPAPGQRTDLSVSDRQSLSSPPANDQSFLR